MKKGERVVLTCSDFALCAGTVLGVKMSRTGLAVVTLQLIEFEKACDPQTMSETDKIKFGTAQKITGPFRGVRTALRSGI